MFYLNSLLVVAMSFGAVPDPVAPSFADLTGELPSAAGHIDKLKVESLVNSMWQRCETIHSWSFSSVVNYRAYSGDQTEMSQNTIHFDGLTNSLRFEGRAMQSPDVVKFLVTSSGKVQYKSQDPHLIRSSDALLTDDDRFGLWVVDPRCVALSRPDQQIRLSDPYSIMKERFSASGVADVVDVGTRFVELRWVPHPLALVSIVLDKERDYLPVLAGTRQKVSDAGREDFEPGTSYFVECTTSTDWRRIDGVDVPVSVTLVEFDRPSKSAGPRNTFSVDLIWHTVNQQIAESTFTERALDLPEGTKVYETIDEQVVQIGQLDANGVVQERSVLDEKHRIIKVEQVSGYSWRTYSVIVLNILLAVVCFVWLRVSVHQHRLALWWLSRRM